MKYLIEKIRNRIDGIKRKQVSAYGSGCVVDESGSVSLIEEVKVRASWQCRSPALDVVKCWAVCPLARKPQWTQW